MALADSDQPPNLCQNENCSAANPPGERICLRCGEVLPLPAGTLLMGRYRLDRFLKAGGFGAIYRASDTHNQDRALVVKEMIVPDPKEFKTRLNFFIREFEILRLLNDKQVASVPKYYGFFQDEEKRTAHLVMELIPGRNLLEIMEANDGKPFELAQVVEWGKSVCAVLATMHAQDPPFIHRDIKPDNIMLLPDGTVKMIDFGTARELKTNSQKTRVYSEDYAPPEQVLGLPEPRSDLFALAATLYHLATGKFPSGAQTARATVLANPHLRIRPEDHWFFELLRVNLAVKVSDRYPSAPAFKEDLEQKRVRGPADFKPVTPPSQPAMVSAPAPAPAPIPSAPPNGANPPRQIEIWDSPPRRRPTWLIVPLLLLGIGGVIALGVYKGWFSNAPTTTQGVASTPAATGTGSGQTNTGTGATSTTKPTGTIQSLRSFKSKKEILTVIHNDQLSKPTEQRFQRYFTLEHLHNNPKVSNEDLDRQREALTRLLTQFNSGAVAEALAEGTVFRVDTRRLGWAESGRWRKLLAVYPYGLLDPTLGEDLVRLAGNELPMVRADWFTATASRAPLFSKLAPSQVPQLSEAISKAAETYRANLGPQEAALELGLRSGEELRQEIAQRPGLRDVFIRRGLGPLTEGETISRDSWSVLGGLQTPFQEIAVTLGLGAAIRVRE